MGSWLIRIVSILIGVLLVYIWYDTPDHPGVLLAGALFFVGLAILGIWGAYDWAVAFAGALLCLTHAAIGLATGEISAFSRYGHKLYSLATSPDAFWFTFAEFCIAGTVALIYGMYSWTKMRRRAIPEEGHPRSAQ